MTNDCWNIIGVWGDRTCPELQTHIHCRNCPIYSTVGRNLLEREAPVGYVTEWTKLLASEKTGIHSLVSATEIISVVIFRLGVEWLALPTTLFQEVTQASIIHTLPHRTNAIFLGLVNIRGEILTCVSLSALLRLDAAPAERQQTSQIVYQRMVVVEKEGNRWVFPVDEMYGVHRLHPEELQNVPATVSNVPDTYTKGMINWNNKNVSHLDDELLFYTLNKRIL